MTKKTKGRKRKYKDLDQVHEEVQRDLASVKKANYDPDLPGEGQFPCVACDRLFESQKALDNHCKSKAHKRRVKELRTDGKYTQREADAAGGLGSYSAVRREKSATITH